MSSRSVHSGQRESSASGPRGLLRIVGTIVVALSALSQEYGSGINFVVPHSLGKYPATEGLVPLAILVAGLLLIPQVALFSRYATVMPRAGSSYVWLTRSLGPTMGFAVAFLWLIGLCGSIGFVAYAGATFVNNTLHSLGVHSLWAVSPYGRLAIGMGSIWSLAALHCVGVKRYGHFIYVVGGIVVVAAVIVIATGFAAPPTHSVKTLEHVANIQIQGAHSHPSPVAFFATVSLFVFAYGGLSGGTSLGAEVINPSRSMPRGIVGGWLSAVVLYTLVAFALFHAMPWWAALPVLHSGHGYLLTVPSLIGLLVARPVAIALNVLTAIIVIKTIAPQLLCASRFLYAWAEDGFITRRIQSTNRAHAPVVAIVLAAAIGNLFLLDAIFSGWAIGVIVRALSLVLTFAMLGVGILFLSWVSAQRRKRPYSDDLTEGRGIKVMAFLAILIGAPLMALVLQEAGKPWYFQPWFQVAATIAISLVLSGWARSRHATRYGDEFAAQFLRIPAE